MSELFLASRQSNEDLSIAGPEVLEFLLEELDSYKSGIHVEDLINLLQSQYMNWFNVYYSVITADGVEIRNGIVCKTQDSYN